MNCAICQRPLLEGAPACVVCGAPVQAPRVSALPAATGPSPSPSLAGAAPAYGYRPSIPTAPPGSAYGSPPMPTPQYGQMPPPMAAPSPNPMQARPAPYNAYYGGPPVPPMGYPPMAMQPAASNNLAVASLVCGLLGLVPLWIGFILCILAITFGILGIQRAGQLPGARGKGMAIAGLVLGAVFLLPAGCGL